MEAPLNRRIPALFSKPLFHIQQGRKGVMQDQNIVTGTSKKKMDNDVKEGELMRPRTGC